MSGAGPWLTEKAERVLRVMLDQPDQELHGPQICAAAGLPVGSIHPTLARLESLGWLTSRWEDTFEPGRPRRRYYRLTPDGAEQARQGGDAT